MAYLKSLKCVFCNRIYAPKNLNTCPSCGITGTLDAIFDYEAIARVLTKRVLAARPEQTLFRYRELLPIGPNAKTPPLPAGWSPMLEAKALARHIGIRTLYVKDDGRNATGSLKDRASAIGVTKALEKRKRIISCASTGNAASSCAGMAASLGLRSVIFIPQRAPEAKVTQLLIFGATVLRVQGSYEQAFQLCQQACEQHGWYNRNSAINPYLVEGKKTAGLEIAEQLDWQPPDWVAVSVGDGCTIAGVWKGFRELHTLGLIPRTPRMLGVQAEGAAPVTTCWLTGNPLVPVEPQTIADSIAVGVPRNWKKAVMAIHESGGAMIDVSDEEILDAMRYTGRLAGVFAEPAAATAMAGLRKALTEEVVDKRGSAVALITGSGLKDIASARMAVGAPFEISPDGGGLNEILASQELVS